jgi:hypothetical protein
MVFIISSSATASPVEHSRCSHVTKALAGTKSYCTMVVVDAFELSRRTLSSAVMFLLRLRVVRASHLAECQCPNREENLLETKAIAALHHRIVDT